MILNDTQRKELHEASKPLLKWLNDNCHPHCHVVVEPSRIELVESVGAIIDMEFVKD